MRKRDTGIEPLGFVELLRAATWPTHGQAVRAREFVNEHRATIEAHAAGLPLRHGHDGTRLARRLLDLTGEASR